MKVLDFGIAKLRSAEGTGGHRHRRDVRDRLLHVARAGARGRRGRRAIGRLVAGRGAVRAAGRPPAVRGRAVPARHLRDPQRRGARGWPTVRPGLPPSLVAAIERAMAKDPQARWPSVSAFAEALAPFAGQPARPASAATAASTTALSVGDLPRGPGAAARRPRAVLWLVAAAVALVVASLVSGPPGRAPGGGVPAPRPRRPHPWPSPHHPRPSPHHHPPRPPLFEHPRSCPNSPAAPPTGARRRPRPRSRPGRPARPRLRRRKHHRRGQLRPRTTTPAGVKIDPNNPY